MRDSTQYGRRRFVRGLNLSRFTSVIGSHPQRRPHRPGPRVQGHDPVADASLRGRR
ncbi:hypothetical protein [Kitasatospora sp. HPMI-4]|uniref:hypothetical protein n=1 Tax=Kitasatospora sp. HPMI-4 TaxID=3448443 RepID=UPI003F1A95E6